ncbi:MAG: hypothetical protein ABI904_22035 [Chloroflexota bacterium]
MKARSWWQWANDLVNGNPNLKQSFQQSAGTSQESMWFLFQLSVLISLFNVLGASVLGLGLIDRHDSIIYFAEGLYISAIEKQQQAKHTHALSSWRAAIRALVSNAEQASSIPQPSRR